MPGRNLILRERSQELILHPQVGRCLTLEALAERVRIHPDLVQSFVVYGLLQPVQVTGRVSWFDLGAVRRLRTICRLRDDLGINLPGIAAILDLLERNEALQRELATLRRR